MVVGVWASRAFVIFRMINNIAGIINLVFVCAGAWSPSRNIDIVGGVGFGVVRSS